MGLTKPKIVKSTLPELSNPATEENIEYGFEAIDGEGNVITGEREIPSAVWGHVVVSSNVDSTFNIPLPFSGDVTSIIGSCHFTSGTFEFLFGVNNETTGYYLNSSKSYKSVSVTRKSNTALNVAARSTGASGSASTTKTTFNFAVCQDPEGTTII